MCCVCTKEKSHSPFPPLHMHNTCQVQAVVLGQTLTVIEQTDVYMHCADICAEPTLPASAALPSPSPSPSPPLEPPTCRPGVTLSQMCASLNRVKNHTLSLATSGDCTISNDCRNLQCAFTASFSGFPVPVRENMTLLPCTSPYSFGLVVSSTLLGGDLVNGVFSESSDIDFTALGFSGVVAITVVQQEFGVTMAVSLCSLELHTQVYVCYFLCVDYLTFGLCFLTG